MKRHAASSRRAGWSRDRTRSPRSFLLTGAGRLKSAALTGSLSANQRKRSPTVLALVRRLQPASASAAAPVAMRRGVGGSGTCAIAHTPGLLWLSQWERRQRLLPVHPLLLHRTPHGYLSVIVTEGASRGVLQRPGQSPGQSEGGDRSHRLLTLRDDGGLDGT
jgi:hypothetical protein